MQIRHQVFISSTFTDLRDERQAAVEAVLRAGHIPAGMELFAAESRTQLEVVKRWIDESDVYILIVGSRYGSIEPESGHSYTEFEYRYALDNGKPAFALVLDDAAIDRKHREFGAKASDDPARLAEFKRFVMSKVVRLVSNTDQIKVAVLESILALSQRRGFGGWIRAKPDHLDLELQVAKLTAENARLSASLAKKASDQSKDVDALTWAETLNRITVKFGKNEIVNLLNAFLANANTLATGVSNAYASSPQEAKLYLIAAELAALGLAERVKVPANVHWTRLALSKEGVQLARSLRILMAKQKIGPEKISPEKAGPEKISPEKAGPEKIAPAKITTPSSTTSRAKQKKSKQSTQ